MNLTGRGREALEAYVAEVERSLTGCDDVDVDDVLDGIREHVESELLARDAADPATAEEVEDILERLGPPELVAREGAGSDPVEGREIASLTLVSILLSVALGLSLLLVPSPLFPLGWVLLIGGLTGARLVLPNEGAARSPADRAVLLVWRLGVSAAAVALLLGPAGFVWAEAQTGGLLEGPLSAWTGPHGSDRAVRYWLAMGSLAGAMTGIWWMLCGWLTSRLGRTLRRALGATWLPLSGRAGRILGTLGAALLGASVLGAWLG